MQQNVAQLPWGHLVRILDRVKEPAARRFYVGQALVQGWTRNVLMLHVDRGLHARQGQAVTNFATTLPAPESGLAAATLKDPYVFDFLGLGSEAHEREIEHAMVAHIRDTLVGTGEPAGVSAPGATPRTASCPRN